MANTQNTLTVTARAVDNASGPLKDVAKAVGQLPAQFSRAAGAMSAMGGAVEQIGGPVAAATGKLAQLGSLISTGGPLGIAIAGLTLAVSAGVEIWDTYREAAKRAEEAGRSVTRAFGDQRDRVLAANKSADAAEKSLSNFGKSAGTIRLAELDEQIGGFSSALTRNAEVIDELEPRVRELRGTVAALAGIHTKSADAARAAAAAELEGKEALLLATVNGTNAAQAQFDAAQRESESILALAAAEEMATSTKKSHALATRIDAEEQKKKNAIDKDAEDILGKLEVIENQVSATRRKATMAMLDQKVEAGQQEISVANNTRRKMIKDEQKANDDRVKMSQRAAETIVDGYVEIYGSIRDGSKTASEAFKELYEGLGKMVLKQAATFVIAKGIEIVAEKGAAAISIGISAAVAAARAFSAYIGIPIWGIALGAAAAVAAIAAVFAYKNFAKGGLVTGGIAGKDSVPAMLMPGEVVLPVDMVQRLHGAGALGGASSSGGLAFAGGGMVPAARGGGQVQVNFTHQSTMPVSSAATQRALIRDVKGAFMSLVRDGHLPLAVRA